MIIPPSGSIEIPQKTYDGIWITNIQIMAPSPLRPIIASIQVCPFNSSTGELDANNRKVIQIPNVDVEAQNSSYVAQAMGGIFGYVQNQVISKSLF